MEKKLRDAFNTLEHVLCEYVAEFGNENGELDAFDLIKEYVVQQERDNKRRRGIKTPLFDVGDVSEDDFAQEFSGVKERALKRAEEKKAEDEERRAKNANDFTEKENEWVF